MLIETEDAARRLARALASDIRLYSGEKLARGEDLSSELAEGRALFRTRVSPKLYSVFEAVLAEQHLVSAPAAGIVAPSETSPPNAQPPRLSKGAPATGTLAPLETSPPSALPAGLFEDAPAPARAQGRGALLLGVMLLAAAIAWFALR